MQKLTTWVQQILNVEKKLKNVNRTALIGNHSAKN